MEPENVHVSLGQFESTAISKLVTRGVREDVARAFVTVGLRKQDGYSRYKDIVCKAKFHSFFVHKPSEGAMVPQVLERRTNKFRAPYAMTGKEKAEMMVSFPELDIICDGTLRNPHAFYANKRLAECELLISLVWSAAMRYGNLDPRSIVDLGGNQTQHMTRNRSYVHCDTPVMSAKDIYRYTVREVYSGVDPMAVCKRTFHTCTVSADFGIGVHSTYDLSPEDIASGMVARNMKMFFGVVNIHPLLGSLAAGEYVHDGMVLKVTSDKVAYSFVHDSSLSYSHSKYTMAKYLNSCSYLPVKTCSGVRHFKFEHKSVRGSTIVFSISEVDAPVAEGTSIATGMRSGRYRISMDGQVDPFEVDRELFDRMVLMAAASRKIEEYNITALFKYAKSLRQRISINSIVLSTGFKEDTESLVRITVAALAVASAFHQESSRLFATGAKEIMAGRNKSVFSDVYKVSIDLVSTCVSALGDVTGISSGVSAVKTWADELVKAGNSVVVSVATVKEFGNRFEPKYLGTTTAQLGKPDELEWFSYKPVAVRESSFDYTTMSYVCIYRSGFPGHAALEYTALAGYGYRRSYPDDLCVSRVTQGPFRLSGVRSMLLESSSDPSNLYSTYLRQYPVDGASDLRVRTLANGDSVVHVVTKDPDNPGIDAQHCFIAFRGIGTKFVVCDRPEFYSSRCLRFVLFFEEDISSMVNFSASLEVEKLPNPLYSVVKHCASNVMALGSVTGVAYTSSAGTGYVTDLRPRGAGMFGSGTVPNLVASTNVDANTRAERLQEVFHNAADYISDTDDDGDDVLEEAVGAMCNSSVGSGGSDVVPVTPLSGRGGAASAPVVGVASTVVDVRGVTSTVGPAVASDADLTDASRTELTYDADAPAEVTVGDSESVVVTDHFGAMLRNAGADERRQTWASEVMSASSGFVDSIPGAIAMSELLAWAEETGKAALSVGKRNVSLARAAFDGDLSERNWHGIKAGLEGSVEICRITSDGKLVEYFGGSDLPHMAVTDGDHILVTKSLPVESGPYVTYSDLEVWTVSSIVEAVSRNLFNTFECPVELIEGPAGCGKTTEICAAMTPADMGLCETKAAARDTASRLRKMGKTTVGEFRTVDSFLINRASTFSSRDTPVGVLYIDEALRLHAGKLWCLLKVVRPTKVVCYGDPEQIPLLPFTPGFEFSASVFPWTSRKLLQRTFRLPADITMMLVRSGYYPYEFKTHSPVVKGYKGTKQFYQGIFAEKPEGCVVLTYTQSAAEDLRREGVHPVMTVGESQGKDLDEVWLYRESDLAKDIYYNKNQTLTAITRVKRAFTFVTVCIRDESEISRLLSFSEGRHVDVSSFMH